MPLPRGFRYPHCKRGHPLADAYTRPDNGRRECRICRRDRAREWARRKRLAERAPPPTDSDQ